MEHTTAEMWVYANMGTYTFLLGALCVVTGYFIGRMK